MDDSILLASERGAQEAQFGDDAGPALDEEETEKASGDVEGGDDADGEVELVGDDAEDGADEGAHDQATQGDLLRPGRDHHILIDAASIVAVGHKQGVFEPSLSLRCLERTRLPIRVHLTTSTDLSPSSHSQVACTPPSSARSQGPP